MPTPTSPKNFGSPRRETVRPRLRITAIAAVLLSAIVTMATIGQGGTTSLAASAAPTPPASSSSELALMTSPTPFPSAVTVSAGSDHTCAISDAGVLSCWGRVAAFGSTDDLGFTAWSPVEIPDNSASASQITNSAVTAVATGNEFTCAIEGGVVYCWGADSNGSLGNGGGYGDSEVLPTRVPPAGDFANDGDVTAVSASNFGACAIENGIAFCWGDTWLGAGSAPETSPIKVAAGSSGFTNNGTVSAVTRASNHTCVLEDGIVYCWGQNTKGQLGDGSTTNSSSPVRVAAATGFSNNGTVSAVAAGPARTCAIEGSIATDDARLFCWGNNETYNGVLGVLGGANTSTASQTTAQLVSASATSGFANTSVSAVSVGIDASCAIEDSVAYCWGHGDFGRLGNGSENSETTPAKVAVGSDGFTNTTVAALAVVSGAMNGCAVEDIGAENRLYCWGDASRGKLGNGRGDEDGSFSAVPVLVCVDCDITPSSGGSGGFPGPSSGSVPPPPPPTVATTVPETTTPPTTQPVVPTGPRPVTAPASGQVPALIDDTLIPAVQAAPGTGVALIDGEPVTVEVQRVDTPAIEIAPEERTPEQVAEIRDAARTLVDTFNQGAPEDATPLVTVTDTDTGAELNGMLVDPIDGQTPIPVPVEDVVLVDATTTKVLLAAATPDGEPEQVQGGVLEVIDGGAVAALAYGLPAGEPGEVVILSTPTLLGTFTTNDDGSFAGQLDLPADLEPGDHTVVLTAGGITTSLGVRVYANGDNEIIDTPTTVAPGDVELPATGNDDTTTQLIIWATLITLAGATITLRRRHLH